MFKCELFNVKLENTILAQLKESHQVLVMVSRRLLLSFSVTNNDKVVGHHFNVPHPFNQLVHPALEYLWS